mmetsp:Transcript_21136/g.68421  ORF Transcript_21136/g.68421 Transcript_21136/m.68421 type:complete len:220 (+) Transcript_21136:548-1207(+)
MDQGSAAAGDHRQRSAGGLDRVSRSSRAGVSPDLGCRRSRCMHGRRRLAGRGRAHPVRTHRRPRGGRRPPDCLCQRLAPAAQPLPEASGAAAVVQRGAGVDPCTARGAGARAAAAPCGGVCPEQARGRAAGAAQARRARRDRRHRLCAPRPAARQDRSRAGWHRRRARRCAARALRGAAAQRASSRDGRPARRHAPGDGDHLDGRPGPGHPRLLARLPL